MVLLDLLVRTSAVAVVCVAGGLWRDKGNGRLWRQEISNNIFVKLYFRTANEKLTRRRTALRAIVAGTGVSTCPASFIWSIISCSSRWPRKLHVFSTYASVLLNIGPFLSIPGNLYEELINDYVIVVILLAPLNLVVRLNSLNFLPYLFRHEICPKFYTAGISG